MTVGYFLKMPGFFRYLFVAQIITFPYFVNASFELIQSLTQSPLLKRRLEKALAAVLTLLILFQTYQVLFHSFVAGYYQNTRSQELTTFFQQLDPSKHVFFYHTPEAITFFPRENYSQYFHLLYFNDAIGKDQLKSIEDGVPDIIFVAGESEHEIEGILGKYHKQALVDNGNYIVYERQ
jgi:hypothetical protein